MFKNHLNFLDKILDIADPNLRILIYFLELVDDNRQIFHLLEHIVLEQLIIVVKLIFHLFVGFEIIFFEELPIFVFVLHVVVQILEVGVDLLLGLSLEAGEVFVLFDPEIAVEGEFVFVFYVFGVGFYRFELG